MAGNFIYFKKFDGKMLKIKIERGIVYTKLRENGGSAMK